MEEYLNATCSNKEDPANPFAIAMANMSKEGGRPLAEQSERSAKTARSEDSMSTHLISNLGTAASTDSQEGINSASPPGTCYSFTAEDLKRKRIPVVTTANSTDDEDEEVGRSGLRAVPEVDQEVEDFVQDLEEQPQAVHVVRVDGSNLERFTMEEPPGALGATNSAIEVLRSVTPAVSETDENEDANLQELTEALNGAISSSKKAKMESIAWNQICAVDGDGSTSKPAVLETDENEDTLDVHLQTEALNNAMSSTAETGKLESALVWNRICEEDAKSSSESSMASSIDSKSEGQLSESQRPRKDFLSAATAKLQRRATASPLDQWGFPLFDHQTVHQEPDWSAEKPIHNVAEFYATPCASSDHGDDDSEKPLLDKPVLDIFRASPTSEDDDIVSNPSENAFFDAPSSTEHSDNLKAPSFDRADSPETEPLETDLEAQDNASDPNTSNLEGLATDLEAQRSIAEPKTSDLLEGDAPIAEQSNNLKTLSFDRADSPRPGPLATDLEAQHSIAEPKTSDLEGLGEALSNFIGNRDNMLESSRTVAANTEPLFPATFEDQPIIDDPTAQVATSTESSVSSVTTAMDPPGMITTRSSTILETPTGFEELALPEQFYHQSPIVDPIIEIQEDSRQRKKVGTFYTLCFVGVTGFALLMIFLLGYFLGVDRTADDPVPSGEVPTLGPVATANPTNTPSPYPTAPPTSAAPLVAPMTSHPTMLPTPYPTASPTSAAPLAALATAHPTMPLSPYPTAAPSAAPTTANPTIPPTPYPTSSPTSAAPSAAPTTALDRFMAGLPDYTLETMQQDTESPQSLALKWLFEQEGVDNMPQWRQTQLFVLATVYYSLAGPFWPAGRDYYWLDLSYGRTECNWYSKTTDISVKENRASSSSLLPCNALGQYQSLRLEYLELSSYEVYLPPEVELLTTLREIEISSSDIRGELWEWIPTQLSNMVQLEELNVKRNNFMGPIPEHLPPALTRLYLESNQLAGTISSSIGLLTSLQDLDLSTLSLTGTIPTEVGLITNLSILKLYDNYLSGNIPTQIGFLRDLEGLSLQRNQLTGSIPTEIAWLSSLRYLYHYGNNAYGPIPAELGALTALERLLLHSNSFSGPIPSALNGATSLQILDLRNNLLSGAVPRTFGSMSNLVEMFLDRNSLMGPLPTHFGLLSGLQMLSGANNRFSGPLPSELAMLTNLRGLDMFNNSLRGMIPTEFGSLSALTGLYLGNNALGSLPSEIALASNLEILDLMRNALSGTIPSELAALAFLKEFKAQDNLLFGKIPSQLGQMATITHLALNSNRLTGTIPLELTQLTDTMAHFNASDNQLSGRVPRDLCVYKDSFDCTHMLCGCRCICTNY